MIKYITIYQVKDIENTLYAFRDFDDKFNFSDYENKYSCQMSDVNTDGDVGLLEQVFEIFNIDRPEDFKGHSLSVSDIVKVDNKYYYCEIFGWKDITEYMR